MIEAMIFDLDGTLVQTEKLKALSYARAAVELCPASITEDEVIEAFREVVGLAREKVATTLVERFELTAKANARKAEFAVETTWQAYVAVRMQHYEAMLADPEVLRSNRWPHNIALLKLARSVHCKVGLATMSHRPQVNRVLEILDLNDQFDFVATRDDVENGKPDPEIYLMVADRLGVAPANTLVIEDSPSGVEASINAGMHTIAVTTPFTRKRIHAESTLDSRWIVDDPLKLLDVVNQLYQEQA